METKEFKIQAPDVMKLTKQAIEILGEKTIKTALSTDW